jgi:hypothetical protein
MKTIHACKYLLLFPMLCAPTMAQPSQAHPHDHPAQKHAADDGHNHAATLHERMSLGSEATMARCHRMARS